MPENQTPDLPSTFQVGATVRVPADRLFPEGQAAVVGVMFLKNGAVRYLCESPATGRQQLLDEARVVAA